MKKRIFIGLVLGAMMMGTLTGCGKEKNVERTEKKSVNTEAVDTQDADGIEFEETINTDILEDVVVVDGGANTELKIGASSVYSQDEMMAAAELIKNEFLLYFTGCELVDVTFDETVSSQYDQINKQQYGEADYVVFTSTFNVPENYGEGPLNAGETYENYQWILTMDANGQWELVSSGY